MSRARVGEALAAAAGAALALSPALPWYGPEARSGFAALRVLDIVLVLLGAGIVACSALARRAADLRVALAALATGLGGLAAVCVLVRAGLLPDGAATRERGLAVALVSALAACAGGVLATAGEPPLGPDEARRAAEREAERAELIRLRDRQDRP
jgi:hypothetical protein